IFNVLSLAIDPMTPSTLYAATGAGVFKSTNGGERWTAANAGLPGSVVVVGINVLAIDPVHPSTVYAANGSLFKSNDGGATWSTIGQAVTEAVTFIAIDPGVPSRLYVGTGNGVFTSADGGETWSAANAGLSDVFVATLAIDPRAARTIYASSL